MHIALHRSAALSLALVAMLLRAFLPDGWMPSVRSSVSPFTICSVQPVSQTGKVPHREDRTHMPCAFAAASTLAPTTFVALKIGRSSAARHVAAPLGRGRPDSVQQYSPNIARAPPALA